MSNLRVTFDISQFESDLNTALDAIHDGAVHGLDRGAEDFLGIKRQRMQATYNRAIPNGPDGSPLWDRTGAWLNGQEIQRTGEMERTITTTGEAAAYERHLSNLPTGADGVNRTNNAAGDALRIYGPKHAHFVEEGINRELRRRRQGGNNSNGGGA